jgi:hypothetical protein
MTKNEKVACLKQMLHEVSPSGAGADMLDSLVDPDSDDVHPCNTCERDWTDCMVGALQCKGYRPRTPVSVPYGEGGRG